MTCIAIRKIPTGFEVAADSQTSWGSKKYPQKDTNSTFEKSGKIFEVNNMFLGCSGMVSHIQMFAIYCKSHRPKNMETDDILDWVVEFKQWCNTKFNVKQDEISLHGVVISGKRAFVFYDFLEVHEVKEFDSVGSGMFLAIGAMEVGATALDAVRVAAKYDVYCGFDVIGKII
jgi:hypothetical protein